MKKRDLKGGVKGCDACRVERDDLLPTEAFVLGLMIADLQRIGRRRMHATLCDRHARFPHRAPAPPPSPEVAANGGHGGST